MFSVSGNPGITDTRVYSGPTASPASPPTSPPTSSGGAQKKTNTALIAGVAGGIVGAIVLIICVAAIICIPRNKNGSLLEDNKPPEPFPGNYDESLHLNANYICFFK